MVGLEELECFFNCGDEIGHTEGVFDQFGGYDVGSLRHHLFLFRICGGFDKSAVVRRRSIAALDSGY